VEDYAPIKCKHWICAGSSKHVDGSGSYVGGQAVEDYDGTQGEFCSATAAGTVPRC